MAPRNIVRDFGSVRCQDDHVIGHGRERCLVGDRGLEGSDHDGSGHCGYGRDEHGCGHYDRGVHGRNEHGRDEHGRVGNDHHVDGRFDAGQLRGNALNGHVRRASVHAHDARGRRRSCQRCSLAARVC